MRNVNEQIDLIKRVRQERLVVRPIIGKRPFYRSLSFFLKKNRSLFWSAIFLLFFQGLAETFLIFISRNHLISSNFYWSNFSFWLPFLGLVIIFIFTSFFSIKQEKTFVVFFINYLRNRIFKNYLRQKKEKMSFTKQADLIAKISYHLPLVSMGLSNSFFGFFRWVVYLGCALLVSYLADLNVWLILIFLVLISSVITLSSYFIVRKYVSQEVTFYSQIIRHIDLNLSEKYFNKIFKLEKSLLKKFNNLVSFDSIFRIRRDLWMKMSFKIVFLVFLIISILANIFYDQIILQINLIDSSSKFLYLFLLIYLSRTVMESLRIGLYLFPGKLGLSLTDIKLFKDASQKYPLKIKNRLSFYISKAKLFKTGRYYKDVSFDFKLGGRYLLVGPNFSGKTVLAKLFAGVSAYTSKGIKVKVDGERLDFTQYQLKDSQTYFFDKEFKSEKSLIEVIIGKDREDTRFEEIERVLSIANRFPELGEALKNENNFNRLSSYAWGNNSSSFALHVLHCLFKRPQIIIIDNQWLDLGYQSIDNMLKLLSNELTNSIIIVFSTNKINNLNYHHQYELA